MATPGTSLALELSCCQQVEFEVREDSPGLRYTTPDGSKKWTPVVVNVRGHESEFNVFDVEGIPKNVSFCMFNDTPCLVTSFGPAAVKCIHPLPRGRDLELVFELTLSLSLF